MNFTKLKTKMAALIAIVSVSAAVSCEKNPGQNDKPGTEAEWTLELKYQTHSSINIPQNTAEVRYVDLVTNLAADQLKVSEKNGKDWCEAGIVSQDNQIQVRLSPVNDMFDKDLTATFVVEAVGIDGVKPLEFSVSRAKLVYLELSPEMDFNYFAKPEGEILELTVNTNADRWSFKDVAEGDKGWYSISPTEGTDGTVVTIEFKKNTTSGEYGNMGQFQFGVYKTEDAEGKPLPEPVFEALQFFTVMQSLYVESNLTATAVTVSDMMSGEIADGGRIDFEADPIMGVYLNITATPQDGGYEVRFTETGTDNTLPDSWVSLTPMGMTNNLEAKTNTGAERKADMVIVGAENKELFRCTIVQAGV